MTRRLKVGVVGLRFGGEFPPIYRFHPDVEEVVLCEADEGLLQSYAARFGFSRATDSFESLLRMDLDAIHIVTGIPNHAELTVRALNAGKHVACTVPMATSLEDIDRILNAQAGSQRNYMMMETSIYTFQCFQCKEIIERGDLGRIQYMRGTHFQDMEGWPDYWMGLPPMWYATHAVAPLLFLSNTYATRVQCFGSGTMRPSLVKKYNNPFPIEHALVELNDPSIVAELTRSLFHTAISYVEGFTILGDKSSFEWNIEDENPCLHHVQRFDNEDALSSYGRGREIRLSRIDCPDRSALLPESIRPFTKEHTVLDASNPHLSIKQGGGHHGAHPHLVHEFVRSIIEDRKPTVDAVTSARWTAVGICAHQSAMRNGESVNVPTYG